jgi:hypothetical protein
MHTDKVIVRAVLSTLAAVFVLLVSMFAALAFLFPSTLMQITYDFGFDGASIRYATRSYDRSEEIYFIAFATEVAIGDNDYEKIDDCGSRFIEDSKFADYADERNAKLPEGATTDYKQYIYGQVCVAKYRRNKKSDAVEKAFEWNGDTFTENNAVVAVLLTSLVFKDSDTVAVIREKLETQKTANETEAAYLASMINLASSQLA